MSKRARHCIDTPPKSLMPPSPGQQSNPPKTTQFSYTLSSKPKNETFSSRGAKPKRYTIEVVLSIPEAEEECPLTLDSIAESKLPFLDVPFLPDRPNHTKLTLPCKHSFSAMTLLYNFCKNKMVCPCCRAGEDVQADTACLPTHFRTEFNTRIQETIESERVQDEESAFNDTAANFSLFGVTIPYEALALNGNLNLVANFYDIPAGFTGLTTSLRPIFSYSNTVQPSRSSTGRLSLAPRGPLRTLNNLTQVGINSIQLSIQLCMQGAGQVIIDTTPITRLPDAASQERSLRMTIPGASGSSMTHNNQFHVLVQLQQSDENNPTTNFVLGMSRQGEGYNLDSISWSPGTENLEILSSNVSLSAVI